MPLNQYLEWNIWLLHKPRHLRGGARRLVVLPYHILGLIIIRTVCRGRQTNATERSQKWTHTSMQIFIMLPSVSYHWSIEKWWTIQNAHSVSSWAYNTFYMFLRDCSKKCARPRGERVGLHSCYQLQVVYLESGASGSPWTSKVICKISHQFFWMSVHRFSKAFFDPQVTAFLTVL